jgi:hypothetical protein
MMDNETMLLLAKLKVAAKRSGENMDLIRMSSDKEYATTTLNALSNTDDSETVLIAVDLMNRFGMIYTPKKGKEEKDEPDEDRYIGGLR